MCWAKTQLILSLYPSRNYFTCLQQTLFNYFLNTWITSVSVSFLPPRSLKWNWLEIPGLIPTNPDGFPGLHFPVTFSPVSVLCSTIWVEALLFPQPFQNTLSKRLLATDHDSLVIFLLQVGSERGSYCFDIWGGNEVSNVNSFYIKLQF